MGRERKLERKRAGQKERGEREKERESRRDEG